MDYYMGEVTSINRQFLEQREKGKSSNIQIKHFGRRLQDWLSHNLVNLAGALGHCVASGYREEEMLVAMKLVLKKRISSDVEQRMKEIGV